MHDTTLNFGIERLSIGETATPLQYLPNLTKKLAGPKIYIKRDDCTGLAGGGNKVRKLQFLMADALEQGADTIITQGAIQSNHVRQTAAMCAVLGLQCHVLLEDRTGEGDAEFYANGNVFLSQLLGAHAEIYAGGTSMDQAMVHKAETLSASGAKPYIIPGGGSNSIGGLGYAAVAEELVNDAKKLGISLDHVVHATGSAGTQAGLVAGFHLLGVAQNVLGICVRFANEIQKNKVYTLSESILADLNSRLTQKAAQDAYLIQKSAEKLPTERVCVDDRFIGKGYGIPREDTIEAIKLFAQTEGLLLDPVYTGKGAAGLIQLVSEGHFSKDENVIFIHTGGAQSLGGFRQYFDFPEVPRKELA